MRRPRLLFALFLSGALSQAAQALMGRGLLAVFYGSELGLGLFYASWLFWIAAGSLAFARLRPEPREERFALAAALLPAAAVAGLLLLDLCRRILPAPPGQPAPLEQMAFWSLVATGPVGLAVGAALPLACAVLGREEDIAGVYAWDALGGLAGGALLAAALSGHVPAWRLLGLLTAALGVAVFRLESPGRPARSLACVWAALGLAALTPLGGKLQSRMDRLRWGSVLPRLELVESFDTPYQSVAVARLGTQTSIVADGKVAASFPDSTVPALEAALILAEHPSAKRALVLEGTARGLVAELLRYPLESVETVEPDERAFRGVLPYLPPSYRAALEEPRARVRFDDPRLFLNRAPGRAYDLIIALVPDPATAQLNRLFTREFYERCRSVLAEDGVLVTGAASSANYLGRQVRMYDATVYRTLREAFPDVRAAPGDATLFFASGGRGLSLDPAELSRRYRGIRPKDGPPAEALRSLWTAERAAWLESVLNDGRGEVDTDQRPVTYYFNMLIWARFSGSRWAGALEKGRRAGAGLFLIPALVLVLLRLAASLLEEDPGKDERAAACLGMAALGFAAMALELVLLLAFQSAFGSLYAEVGLLNGLFMAGLALGAWVAGRAGASLTPRPWLWLLGCASSSALLARALPGLLAAGSAGEPAYWALALLTGAVTGAGFPAAARLYGLRLGEPARSSGAADAMDHLGGAAGALLTGACLVPLSGAQATCRLVSGVSALACLPVLLVGFKSGGAAKDLLRKAREHPWLRLGERAAPSFPYESLSWWAAGLALTALLLGSAARSVKPAPRREPAPARGGIPEAELAEVSGLERFEYRADPFPHYRNFDASGNKAGASLSTLDVPAAAAVKGFGGPIHLLLSLSEEGRILGLKLKDSKETPSYIEGIGGWLRRFKGLDATRTLRLGKDIDGISGATVTSQAVVEIVGRASAAVDERILRAERPRPRTAEAPAPAPLSWGSPKVLCVGALLALFFPVFLSRSRRARLAYLAASVAVLGFWTDTLISLPDIAALSRGELPGAARAAWVLVGAFALLTSALWGQVYCGFVCPFGAAQELLWTAARGLGLRASPSRPIDQAARYGKYLILAGALSLYWLTGRVGWLSFEPMQRAFLFRMSGTMALLLAGVLLASAGFFRFWCRYFCPTGAFLALANKLALGRRLAPKREFRYCDLGVRSEYDVDCIQCQRCVYHGREVRRDEA